MKLIRYSEKRLTYEEVHKIGDTLIKCEPYYDIDSSWYRVAENNEYALDYNRNTADQRIVNKKENTEVWSYYGDFYNGEN